MELFNRDKQKELEHREKEIEITRKEFDLETERHFQSSIRPKQLAMDEKFMRIISVGWLSGLLTDVTIDEDRTIFGSEPFYKPAFSAHNRKIIEQKVMDLIKQL